MHSCALWGVADIWDSLSWLRGRGHILQDHLAVTFAVVTYVNRINSFLVWVARMVTHRQVTRLKCIDRGWVNYLHLTELMSCATS